MQFDVTPHAGPGAQTVLLSSGLGGAAAYWAPQIPALASTHRVITYDHAGTGRNARVLPDGYAIDDMAEDVLTILDASETETCHFVGHALGALVGLAVARRAPERLRSLILVNGWASVDAHTRRCFEARLALLEHVGVAAYVRAQPIFLYPAAWLAVNAERVAAEDAHGVAGFQGKANLLRRIAGLLAFDAHESLGDLRVPVLVMAARDDILVACTQSEDLAGRIPEAKLDVAEWGGHALNVTAPDRFNAVLVDFLADHVRDRH